MSTTSPVRDRPRAPIRPAGEAAATPTLLQPRFMARFACLGDACPDTCCSGWTIDIEPSTARRWRTHPDPSWRERLASALRAHRLPDGQRRTLIRLDDRGCCPLLREDGLCSVHAALGESELPEICRTFPRLDTGEGTLRHRTGSIACVEVARRVLLDADALDETCAGDPLVAVLGRRPGQPMLTGPAVTAQEAAWVRTTVLRVLRNATVPWSARVALFCVTLEDLGKLDLVRRRQALVDLLLGTEAVLAHADVGGFDGVFPATHEGLVAAFVPILRVLSEAGARDPVIGPTMRALVEPIRRGLGDDEGSLAGLATNYARAARERLEPELATRPHLLGNLYGALLLHHRFPFGRPATAVEAAWSAAFFLALWKVATIGAVVGAGREFEEAAVEVAYRLGRALAHWPAAKALLRKDFASRGALTPAVLAALLR